MDNKTARQLLKFVNDPWVLEDLKIYVSYRIDFLRRQLELATSMDEVRKIQGAIHELRQFNTLKDLVRQKAEE